MRRTVSLLLALLSFAFAPSANAQWKSGGVAFPITPLDDQTALLPDGQGGAFLFFLLPSGGRVPRAQHVLSNGTIDPLDGSSGRVVAPVPFGIGRATAISDGVNGMLVAFQRCAPPQAHTLCWEAGQTRLTRWGPGGTSPGWPDSGVVIELQSSGPDVPHLVSGGDGGAIVLLGSALARWTGACTTPWTPEPGQPGVRVSTGTQQKIETQIAPDGSGGAWAVWAEVVAFNPSLRRIYLNHVGAAGQRQLGNLGMVLAEGPDLRASGIAPDGAGGVYVAWSLRVQYSGGPVDSVFVQHVDANGAPWWDAAGAPAGHTWAGADLLLQASGDDAVALPVQDASGQTLLQKLSGGGPGWPGSSVGLQFGAVGASGQSWQPGADGSLFVAWSDSRSGSLDPWATLIDTDGLAAPGWTLGGTALANEPDPEYGGLIVPGATPGEAIVGWWQPSPAFISLYDLVVQKVTTGGVLAVAAPRPALALGSPWPNPARNGWTVSFRLPEPDEAELELFDVAGRRVSSTRVRVEDTGPRQVRLDATGFAPGVYRVRLRARSGERSRAVVLTP